MTQPSSTTTTSATAATTRRYEPLLKIASGGTASVYVGSAVGALGFRQLVAIKRPHAHLADDPTFCAALVEEARIASRLHHANLVDVRDVEVDESGIQLVMDYVEGASLSELIRSWAKEPPSRAEAVALRIVLDACEGLRALHELRGDDDAPLGLVHRDVSPANVLVGLDGVARIADFGLAKPLLAVERTTSEGALRGKLGYMAPEYIRGKSIDARIDVFAMGIVLWEVLSRKRLFRGENDGDTLDRVQTLSPPALAELMPQLGAAGAALDAVIARALAKDPAERLPTIAALSAELEKVIRAHDLGATSADVREAFAPSLKAHLDDRRRRVQSATSQPPGAPIPSQPPPPVSISPVSLASASGQSPATQTASTSIEAPAPSLAQAPSSQPASNEKKRPALLALGAAVVLSAIAGAVVLFTATKETAASGSAPAPHTVAREARPLAIAPRTRVATGEDDDDASASGAASASGPRGGARPRPRPRPKASVEEPGNKAPRPNPYASPPSR